MLNVVVLDNGAGLIKPGMGGNGDPTAMVPHCLGRPLSFKKWLIADQLVPSSSTDLNLPSAASIDPSTAATSSTLTTSARSSPSSSLPHHPLSPPRRAPPQLPFQRATLDLVFEDFSFVSLFVSDSLSIIHLYEASCRPMGLAAKAQTSLVAVKRLDWGGQSLTNYLKELVPYLPVNFMDETFVMDDVKENLCFISLNVARDL